MTFRMKPDGFQFGSAGCASPSALVQQTISVRSPFAAGVKFVCHYRKLTSVRAQCLQWALAAIEQCEKWADEGYNTCGHWSDQGHEECYDWPPCLWFCDAFFWVAKWVCDFFVWIAKWVCIAVITVLLPICLVLQFIIDVFCLVYAWTVV
jgi:hypothetical protein